MVKKFVILLTLSGLFIFGYGADLDRENQRKPTFIEYVSNNDLPRKMAITFSTGASVVLDAACQIRCGEFCQELSPGVSIITSSTSVLFHDAMEGPLVSEKGAVFIDYGFFILALMAAPEIAIGAYTGSYLMDKIATWYRFDPFNKSVFKYWTARICGIGSQLMIPAAIKYFSKDDSEL